MTRQPDCHRSYVEAFITKHQLPTRFSFRLGPSAPPGHRFTPAMRGTRQRPIAREGCEGSVLARETGELRPATREVEPGEDDDPNA